MAAARWCRVSASVSAAGIERTITTASIQSLAGDIHDEFPSTPAGTQDAANLDVNS